MSGLEELVEAALGLRAFTILMENVNLVNVFTGEVYPADVGLYRDRVAYVGLHRSSKLRAETRVDFHGRYYASPGLIDSHLHIESSMVTPRRFAEAVVPRGVTAVAADPHEICNVMGLRGLEVIRELSRGTPLRVYLWVPTCIPSVPGVETAGAEVYAGDVAHTLKHGCTAGLGEVMDYLGVLRLDRRILEIVKVGRALGATVDGHAPMLSGEKLNGYVSVGVEADHEIFSFEEALEKARVGLYVKARRHLLETPGFVEGFKALPDRGRLILATDDTAPDILESEGHLDSLLRRAVELGLDPVEAVQAATIRPASHLKLYDLGAIAPGRKADIVIFEDLEKFKAKQVYVDGRLVAEDQRLTVEVESKPLPEDALETVKLRRFTEEDFRVKASIEEGVVEARILRLRGVETEVFLDKLRVEGGVVEPGGYAYIAVAERHGRTGGLTVGFIDGTGMEEGAVASTVAHDSHNLVVLGRSLRDMVYAANKLREVQGGYVAVRDGETIALVELPVAGLMSDKPLYEVAASLRRFREAEGRLGLEDPYPIPLISLLTLPVIPHARITDKGLYDVDRGILLDIIVESNR